MIDAAVPVYYKRLFASIDRSVIGYQRYFAALDQLMRISKSARPKRLPKSRRAKILLTRSGLTKHELARRLKTTFQKVDSVIEGRSPLPETWADYLRRHAQKPTLYPSSGSVIERSTALVPQQVQKLT